MSEMMTDVGVVTSSQNTDAMVFDPVNSIVFPVFDLHRNQPYYDVMNMRRLWEIYGFIFVSFRDSDYTSRNITNPARSIFSVHPCKSDKLLSNIGTEHGYRPAKIINRDEKRVFHYTKQLAEAYLQAIGKAAEGYDVSHRLNSLFEHHAKGVSLIMEMLYHRNSGIDINFSCLRESDFYGSVQRLLYYPPTEGELYAAKPHTDKSVISLVPINENGDLVLWDNDGNEYAPYITDDDDKPIYVVLAGEILTYLDGTPATKHAVSKTKDKRYSVPFFGNLNRNYRLDQYKKMFRATYNDDEPELTVQDFLDNNLHKNNY